VYVAALVLLGAFTAEDRALARRLVPRRLRSRPGFSGSVVSPPDR